MQKLKPIPKKLKDFTKKLKVPEDFPYLSLRESVIKKPALFWILILIDPRIYLCMQPFPVQEAFKMDVLEVAQMYQMFQRLTRIQQRQPKPNS